MQNEHDILYTTVTEVDCSVGSSTGTTIFALADLRARPPDPFTTPAAPCTRGKLIRGQPYPDAVARQ